MTTRETLRIEVEPFPDDPEYHEHEVMLRSEEGDLLDRFSEEMMGLDPNDILVDPSPLAAATEPRRATIGRCGCGIVDCGSVEITIQRLDDVVRWTGSGGLPVIEFDADQYDGEVQRAVTDRSWEPPARAVRRLLDERVDWSRLARRGLRLHLLSAGNQREGTVSLSFSMDGFMAHVYVPWDGSDLGVVDTVVALLREKPRAWPHVEFFAFAGGDDRPPIAGPGWRKATY